MEKIKNIIKQGEGLKIEFKEAQGGIPKSIYETACAFSNTQGGEILLGVKDNGEITGINPIKLISIRKISPIQSTIYLKITRLFIYP